VRKPIPINGRLAAPPLQAGWARPRKVVWTDIQAFMLERRAPSSTASP